MNPLINKNEESNTKGKKGKDGKGKDVNAVASDAGSISGASTGGASGHGGQIQAVKETPVLQQALVAYLRERGVPTEGLRRMTWQVLGKIWYRPRLLWRFLRNQAPPDDFGET